MKKKTILWLDNHFALDSDKLTVWTDWLDRRQDRFSYIPVSKFSDFVQELKNRVSLSPGDVGYIDVFLIDVMMPAPKPAYFTELGFPKEKWLSLEAGSQLLGLMQNPNTKREAWLQAYVGRRTALFTSQGNINELWAVHVHPEVINSINYKALVKDDKDGLRETSPSQDFIDWMEALHV